MNRFTKQSLVILALVSLALLAQTIYFFIYGDWTAYLKKSARSANIMLDVKSVNTRFPLVLEFDGVGALIPVGRFPVPLAIDRAQASLDVLPLFTFRGDLRYRAELYGGTLSGSARKSFWGDTLEVVSSANDLQLGRYPQMGATYVEGALSFALDGTAREQKGGLYAMEQADFRVTLRDGVYHGGLMIGGLVSVVPMSEISLDIKGKLDKGKLDIQDVRLDSSLGSLVASGKFDVNSDLRVMNGTAKFSIEFTEAGAKAYGGFVQLGAGGKGTPNERNWSGELLIQRGQVANVSVLPGNK